jgi:HAD superfamily hydrolase (TIGR01509 family)
MSVAAALFDWDGTLIDSRAALLAAWYESSEAVLGRRYPDTQADEDVVFTLPGKQIWPTLASDEAQLAELAAAFQEAYEQGSEQAQAFPGVRDMLLELRASGVAIAVVTSKGRRRFAPDAERGRLTEAIDVAICSEDSDTAKPHPGPVLRALEKLDVAAQSAVMIGDTPVDIAAGIAAGVSTIGVTWCHFGEADLRAAGAEAVADRPADVLCILLGENAHTTTTGGAA